MYVNILHYVGLLYDPFIILIDVYQSYQHVAPSFVE